MDQAIFTQALLNADHAIPEGVTCARGEQDSLRFSVYRNNIIVSLIKTLAGRYPVTAQLVGQEFFEEMANTFVRMSPPQSPLMFLYGRDFSSFIQTVDALEEFPYLVDVARLENMIFEVWHARDEPFLAFEDLAAIPSDSLAEIRLTSRAATGCFSSSYPIGSIWMAHKEETFTPPLHWEAQAILVTRPQLDIKIHIIPPEDVPFVQGVLWGMSFGEAVEEALVKFPTFNFGNCLTGLVSMGVFRQKFQHLADKEAN